MEYYTVTLVIKDFRCELANRPEASGKKHNNNNCLLYIGGLFPTEDMQTPPRPSEVTDHLDMKDMQCAETKDVLKISYHVFELWASKRVVMGTQKFNFLQKWPNLQGRLELISCDSYFLRYERFCIFSFRT